MMTNLFAQLLLVVGVVAHQDGDQPLERDLAWVRPIFPGITSMAVNYTLPNGEAATGYLALPKNPRGAPGAFVAAQYCGLGDMEMFRADEAASRGYIAFAYDHYGDASGRPFADSSDCSAASSAATADVEGYKATIANALDFFKSLYEEMPFVYCQGYCFGGGVCYEMGREQLDVAAVIGFHPSVSPLSTESGKIKQSIAFQAHHGELDFAGDAGLASLETEVKGLDNWETIKYGNAFHGFSDPSSSVYIERVAKQSHASMFLFLELLGFSA